MSFLDKLCSEDDEIIDKFMYEEYWYYMYISCMYLKLSSPRWRVFSCIQILFVITLVVYDGTLLFITAMKSDDLFDVFQEVHLTIILIIILMILIPFNKKRPTVSRLHRGLATGLSNYDENIEKFRITLKSPIRKNKKILMGIVLLTFSLQLILVLIIGPTLDRYLGDSTNEIYSPSGVSLNLPVPLWSLFGTDTWTNFMIEIGNEVVLAGCVATVISGCNLMVFVVVEHIALELDLLSYSLTKLPERTLHIYKERHGDKYVNIKNIKEDKDLSKCYKECLKQNIIHHQKIIESFNQFNGVDALVLFMTHSVGAMMIAMSGALIIFAEGKAGSQITSITFCIFEILNLYYEDWFSEQMIQASDRLAETLYSIKWMDVDRECARIIHIMLIRSQSPLMMNVGSIMSFNYETFSNLMNSSYSYFNLLFAFAEKFT